MEAARAKEGETPGARHVIDRAAWAKRVAYANRISSHHSEREGVAMASPRRSEVAGCPSSRSRMSSASSRRTRSYPGLRPVTSTSVPGRRNHLYVPPGIGRPMTKRSVSGSVESRAASMTNRPLSGKGSSSADAAEFAAESAWAALDGRSRIGYDRRVVSGPATATRSYRGWVLSGTGSHARNAPFGSTDTA